MVFDADLTGELHTVTDFDTAGDAGLGNDDAVPADRDVMADVNQAVNLGPFADAGFAAGPGPGNGNVCSDVNVVFDDDSTRVLKLAKTISLAFVPEPVAADDRAGPDADAGPD